MSRNHTGKGPKEQGIGGGDTKASVEIISDVNSRHKRPGELWPAVATISQAGGPGFAVFYSRHACHKELTHCTAWVCCWLASGQYRGPQGLELEGQGPQPFPWGPGAFSRCTRANLAAPSSPWYSFLVSVPIPDCSFCVS